MKLLTALIIILAVYMANSQDTLTIGEVYDFEIGDEFQYFDPTNHAYVERITIKNKFYSSDFDTVYYVRSQDNFHEIYNSPPGEDFNQYISFIDTFFYTNLNNPIIPFDELNFHESHGDYVNWNDTILESVLCTERFSSYIISHLIGYGLYDITNSIAHGKGLGEIIHTTTNHPQAQWLKWRKMYYYKKGGIECGTPNRINQDTTEYTDPINEFLYPNPFNDIININIKNISSITVLNLDGSQVYFRKGEQEHIYTEKYSNGIYFVIITLNNGEKIKQKLIKI